MEQKTNIALGSTFKKIRKETGLSQREIAFRSGLGLHFIRNLEQGRSSLRLDKVNKAFGFLGYELTPSRKVPPYLLGNEK